MKAVSVVPAWSDESESKTAKRESKINPDDLSSSPASPTFVYFLPYIAELDNVDAVAMTSTSKIDVVVHWQDDRLIEKSGTTYRWKRKAFGDNDPSKINSWENLWHPNLKMDFVKDGDAKGEVMNIEVMRTADGTPHIMMYFSFTVTVKHPMDLRHFPFDTQVLLYFFMLEDQPAATQAILLPHEASHMIEAKECLAETADSKSDVYEILDIKLIPTIVEEEWSRVLTKFGILSEADRAAHSSDVVLTYSNMELRILVRRQPFFFVVKVAVVIWVLMMMAPVTFWLERTAVQDRLGVSVTLALTAVAFQYVVNAYLPALPYLTSLDTQVMVMYLLYAYVFFENVAVYVVQQTDDDTAATMDSVSFAVYIAAVVISVLSFGISFLQGGRVPRDYSHVVDRTFGLIPKSVLQRLLPDDLQTLQEVPTVLGGTAWESTPEYRKRTESTWRHLRQRIHGSESVSE
jgi:hypothetical protein